MNGHDRHPARRIAGTMLVTLGVTLTAIGLIALDLSDKGHGIPGQIAAILIPPGAAITLAGLIMRLWDTHRRRTRLIDQTRDTTRAAWTVIRNRLDQPLDADTRTWIGMLMADARANRIIDTMDARLGRTISQTPGIRLQTEQQTTVEHAVEETLALYGRLHIRMGLASGTVPPISLNASIIEKGQSQ